MQFDHLKRRELIALLGKRRVGDWGEYKIEPAAKDGELHPSIL
ncbi:MAG TPA: hypothetical protein VGH39_09730 [Xanthobacteraceae bacterium]|jgi:hypothetical protein